MTPPTLPSLSTLPTVGHRARAMRLDPLAAQRVFDALLHTMSRPGVPGRLDVPDGVPPVLLPVVTLADVEVGIAVLEDDDAWADAVRATTGARLVPLPDAGIVAALRTPTPDEVLALCRGSADAPEAAARLVLPATALHAGPGSGSGGDAGAGTELRLTGPGVPGERRLAVTGVDPAVWAALRTANAGFPAGVDVHLVADDGTVASVPRGVRTEEG